MGYPNPACLSSLESELQGARCYQILSFVAKPAKSYTTKPERVLQR
jgi:hypothetical protein